MGPGGYLSAWLAPFWFAGIAMTLGCSSASFSYRAPEGMDSYPDFANMDGGLIVGVEGLYSSGYYEWRAPDGALISQVPFDEFRQQLFSDRLTVDDGRLLLRRRGPDLTQFGILPPTDAPGPLARAVSDWLARAGGLLGDGKYGASQTTNARANLSCAIGADLSLAIWDFTDPNSFRVSAAGVLDLAWRGPGGHGPDELYCVKAPEGALVLGVQFVDRSRPVGQKSRMFMFDVGGGGAQEVRDFNAAHRIHSTVYVPTSDGLAGLIIEEQGDRQILARVILRDGAWVAEEAAFAEQWGPRAASMLSWTSTHETFVAVAASGEIVRVTWPDGLSIIPLSGDVVARADTPHRRSALLNGSVRASPRGDRLLWSDLQSEQFEIQMIEDR